jgi:hypothetical protein
VINTDADGIVAAGTVPYYVDATDAAGSPKSAKFPASGARSIRVVLCRNTSPTLSQVSADFTTLGINISGQGNCANPQRTAIHARATDVDGLNSVTLFFTGPGLSNPVARAMTFNSPEWTSFIYPLEDRMTGPGTVTWWVEAVDGTGLKSVSATHQIDVVRCDADARIASALTQPRGGTLFFGCSQPTVSWAITVTDADEPNQANLKVTLIWVVQHSPSPILSGQADAVYNGEGGWRVVLPSSVVNSWNRQDLYGFNNLNWSVTSTDRFGGTTTKSFTTPLTIEKCSQIGSVPPPVPAGITGNLDRIPVTRRGVRIGRTRRRD